ncbi:hypothetical protein WR25_09622 isoform B [Diploscapter pachys]|uniref:Uncharacterized protein n=1 Tax=Diploscapter pachys TaxID=2018661 RepID=A0A2A2K0C4_9BILA|nr:hypothetical protein WR25_09622 isoform B [Diploscapter pachys]
MNWVLIFEMEVIQCIPSGRPTTPSYVYFENDNVYVGDTAINSPNPGKNLIYGRPSVFRRFIEVLDAKRLIGRQFDDGHVINDKQTLSYDVVREPNEPNRGKAMINIERNGRKERISPEDVAAELLKKMKQYAEDHFGGDEVQGAVIAVPAYFNIRQRSATMEAARLAGLNVLRLVTEPTAAAIALYIKLRDQAKTVLIYDLGGGWIIFKLLDIHRKRKCSNLNMTFGIIFRQ